MRIILVKFKDRQGGEYECFSSLKPFFDQYPEYFELKDKIQNVISRKRLIFKYPDFDLQRLVVRKN